MEPPVFRPFAHLATPNVALYRRVMGEFVAAKRRFVVHLRTEDLHEALARAEPNGHVPVDALADALGQLVEWGNLRADPDTSRVTTVEDFHRARFLYQLTHAGEAAERALGVYEEQLGKRGALQAVALADIATQLRALRELAGEADPDPARLGLLLRGLVDRFEDLADNAQAFMGSLRRTIELHDADVDAFRAYKDQLVDYLERFIKDLVTVGAEISGLLADFEDGEVTRLLSIVARRDAEDAAPGGGVGRSRTDGRGGGDGQREDEATGERDPREVAYRAGVAAWRERWQGLRQWFVSEPGHPSQAKLLRSRARQAIPDLLAVVASLNERRSGRSDRSADFRALALWFAEAPDDGALGPQGLAEARERLLRQSADAWSEEDRAAVGAFLQAQIQEVRSRDVAGTWIEQLTEALDYRAWHRFAIERHQGGAWRSATGPASGGERVLTASVPLFAAASSYYNSAGSPSAPRLVMLDEAFAGVDDDSRAKCFGLLTAFDLDVVMTSEREWGCYREVPGLAIAQLARMDGIPAVLVSHWEWDGATRTQVERPVATVVAGAAVTESEGGPVIDIESAVQACDGASACVDGPGETEDLKPDGEAPWGTPSSGT